LGDDLERRLEKAARISGQPESQIIRDAVREHCDDLLRQRLPDQLDDVIGAVSSKGGRSRRTGREFTALLSRKRKA
jgi:hypothetical protein